jgi:hypothetical protein
MSIVEKARAFMIGSGRTLDRHRFDALVVGDASASAAVLRSLGAYRNADGGYGWGIEPDLRARESQPVGALHAWEAIADAGVPAPELTRPLLDWLDRTALADGGLPFAGHMTDATACAPFWVQADPDESSLQITAAVTAQALRAARADASVRSHPWLARSVEYCFDEIARLEEQPFAYVLSFALQFLDIASDSLSRASELLERLCRFVPADGAIPVAGGAPGESLHALDYAPEPGRPIRDHLPAAAVDADLDRVEAGQQPDGGWRTDFTSYSDLAALEWRGYTTVRMVTLLRANGRV